MPALLTRGPACPVSPNAPYPVQPAGGSRSRLRSAGPHIATSHLDTPGITPRPPAASASASASASAAPATVLIPHLFPLHCRHPGRIPGINNIMTAQPLPKPIRVPPGTSPLFTLSFKASCPAGPRCAPRRKSWGKSERKKARRKPGKGKKGKAVGQEGGQVQVPQS